MTLTLETGAGVQDANAYATAAFITTYLTDRNRLTENTWSSRTTAVKEAAAIAATDYIDRRWGLRFKGSKSVWFDGMQAVGRLVFAANPSDTETLTLGDETYTFVAALTDLNNYEVLIGTAAADTVANLIAAINEASDPADVYSDFVIANQHAGAAEGSTTSTIDLTALAEGDSGNDIALSTTAANITPTAFANGRDQGVQPLEFPRSNLYDRYGVLVPGIPRKLKEAVAEYAVRSLSADLFQDPEVDATGRAVTEKTDKIGPITEARKYADGAALSQLIKPYPAADNLLQDYVRPAGRAYR